VLWPPQLDDLKADLGVPRTDTRDDAQLQVVLDAAIATVEQELAGSYNFRSASVLELLLPTPPANVILGTIRYAIRWKTRSNSPDGLVDMGELGSARIPSFDPDIEQLLGIRRYRPPMVL
jgi:hypothetical protein